MGGNAVVGLADGAGGWRGVYVGYPYELEALGTAILDLVVDFRGDLDAVWRKISEASAGWRLAFLEPYDAGENNEYFATGRDEPSLAHDDAFVREHAVCWFVLDLRARTLEAWDNAATTAPFLRERARFEGARPVFERRPESPFDWRNRTSDYGSDDEGETANRVVEIMYERLPIVSRTLGINGLNSANHAVAFTEAGLVFPLVAFVTEPDASQESGVRVTEILEHDHYLLLPRRVLTAGRRCELAVVAALDAIGAKAGEESRVEFPSLATLSGLFPFDLLDLELDDAALRAAVRDRVTSCFEP